MQFWQSGNLQETHDFLPPLRNEFSFFNLLMISLYILKNYYIR